MVIVKCSECKSVLLRKEGYDVNTNGMVCKCGCTRVHVVIS